MRIRQQPPSRGFTLVELMVVVVIVGVLAAIVMPLYSDYIRRGRIPEATSTLAANRVKMEQWFQDSKTYADNGKCHVVDSTGKYFNFTCTDASSAGYKLKATGKDSMLGFVYTLNQSDEKATEITDVSGWKSAATCWVTAANGVC